MVACELLHAMVLFMIGRSAQPLQAQKVCFNKNVFFKKKIYHLPSLLVAMHMIAFAEPDDKIVQESVSLPAAVGL